MKRNWHAELIETKEPVSYLSRIDEIYTLLLRKKIDPNLVTKFIFSKIETTNKTRAYMLNHTLLPVIYPQHGKYTGNMQIIGHISQELMKQNPISIENSQDNIRKLLESLCQMYGAPVEGLLHHDDVE